MPEAEWNSTTTPQESATVCVLALDNIGQYEIPFRSSFETIAGGMLTREKSSTLLSQGGAQPAMSNDNARCIGKFGALSLLAAGPRTDAGPLLCILNVSDNNCL